MGQSVRMGNKKKTSLGSHDYPSPHLHRRDGQNSPLEEKKDYDQKKQIGSFDENTARFVKIESTGSFDVNRGAEAFIKRIKQNLQTQQHLGSIYGSGNGTS